MYLIHYSSNKVPKISTCTLKADTEIMDRIKDLKDRSNLFKANGDDLRAKQTKQFAQRLSNKYGYF